MTTTTLICSISQGYECVNTSGIEGLNFVGKWLLFLLGVLIFVGSVVWFFNWIDLRKINRR